MMKHKKKVFFGCFLAILLLMLVDFGGPKRMITTKNNPLVLEIIPVGVRTAQKETTEGFGIVVRSQNGRVIANFKATEVKLNGDSKERIYGSQQVSERTGMGEYYERDGVYGSWLITSYTFKRVIRMESTSSIVSAFPSSNYPVIRPAFSATIVKGIESEPIGITVKNAPTTLQVGDSVVLDVGLKPEGDYLLDTLDFDKEDRSIEPSVPHLTLDRNGLLTAISAGTSRVFISMRDYPYYSTSFEIRVLRGLETVNPITVPESSMQRIDRD